jgi:hypothetical protein
MISGRTSGYLVMFIIKLNSITSLSSFFSFLFTKHIFTPYSPFSFSKIYPVCFPRDFTKLFMILFWLSKVVFLELLN